MHMPGRASSACSVVDAGSGAIQCLPRRISIARRSRSACGIINEVRGRCQCARGASVKHGVASRAGHAALFDRGGGLIYDSDLDITWLKDGNYAQTSGYTNPAVAGDVVCGRRSHS